ncbi:MAG: hypothetical protein Q4P21_03160, partial [Arthrobacter sp.]
QSNDQRIRKCNQRCAPHIPTQHDCTMVRRHKGLFALTCGEEAEKEIAYLRPVFEEEEQNDGHKDCANSDLASDANASQGFRAEGGAQNKLLRRITEGFNLCVTHGEGAAIEQLVQPVYANVGLENKTL